ncbi:MAG: 1-acyl-sn-glycerol-3-phosphate acyltransferase [Bacteroidota bacterium]
MVVLRWFARQVFKWLGWKIIGDLPQGLDKAVLVMAPHTSNWDFFYGMTTVLIKQVSARFAIKQEVMLFPLGPLLRWLGAIPIDRRRRGRQTAQAAMMGQLFQEHEKLVLIIAPEGTRSYAPRWKTGFYRIAMQAQVPIVLGYLDYTKKHAGIGPVFYPTGNVERDIQEIRAFYKDKTGKYPAQGVW